MIFVLNKQEKVINLLKNSGGNSNTNPFFDDLLVEDLQTGTETFSFSTIAQGTLTNDLVVGNYVAFSKEGKYKLFQITHIDVVHNETMEISVYSECAGLSLINNVFRKRKMASATLSTFVSAVIEDTEWNLGYVDLGIKVSHDLDIDSASCYSVLQNNIGKYGAEIEFRVLINNGRISKKFIDVYGRRGKVTGKRFTFGRDIESITKSVDSTELYTALIGYGKNGINFRDVTVPEIDKPLGQDFVADQQSYELYNRNGYHLTGVYYVESESPEEVLRETYKKLQEVKEPKVSYEIPVALLGHLLDRDWDKVRIGDYITIFDSAFNPALKLMARVSKLETSITNPQLDKCTLSNFVEVTSNISDDMRRIASELEGYVEGKFDAKFPIKGEDISLGAVNGGHIYESSITADHIASGTITADEIHSGTITADKIKTGTITAESGVIGSLDATTIKTGTLDASLITVSNLNADSIVTGTIDASKINVINIDASRINTGSIDADLINVININASNIKSGNIDASKINVTNLNASSITSGIIDAKIIDVTNLNASKITSGEIDASLIKVKNIDATNISTGTLDANFVNVTNLNASSINAGSIDAKVVDVTNLNASKITSGEIDANLIKVKNIDATNITTGILDASLANVINLNANNISAGKITGDFIDANAIKSGHIDANQILAEHIATGAITSDNMVIKDGFIKNAMIDTVNANKINAGSINTNNVKIESADGGIILSGNTQQFKDKNGKVRIQIGKDATGEFTFTLFDETGVGILIDSKGIKEGAIGKGLIKNDMIGNGEIGGAKIDINSMITEVNKSTNTSTIKGSKVQLDTSGQTLDIAFNEMNSTLSDVKNRKGYSVEVTSSNGNVFRNGKVNTTLSAIVREFNVDVTASLPETRFIWTRISNDKAGDVEWNKKYASGRKSINITQTDVNSSATFRITILDENGRILTSN